jgi:hypothetical protein
MPISQGSDAPLETDDLSGAAQFGVRREWRESLFEMRGRLKSPDGGKTTVKTTIWRFDFLLIS